MLFLALLCYLFGWKLFVDTHLIYIIVSKEPSPEDALKQQWIPILWKNLQQALTETTTEPIRQEHPAGTAAAAVKSEAGQPPPAKKAKKERLVGFALYDPYKVWVHVKEFETAFHDNNNPSNDPSAAAAPLKYSMILPEALPTTLGAKLAELSVAGILNGFGLSRGGIVDKLLQPVTVGMQEFSTPAGPCKLAWAKEWAMALHVSIQTRLEKDVLDTTPLRIAHMLCPDLTPAEFKAVRRRVYDTVVLGKGLKVEDITDEIPVASNAQSVHDIEKVCAVCVCVCVCVCFRVSELLTTYSFG
jgi:hypothetical protein